MSSSTFAKCQEVERESRRRMLPYILHAFGSKPVLIPSDYESQSTGDFKVTRRDGFVVNVEAKAELEFTGNLFLETTSNWHTSRAGWLLTSRAFELWYHFLDTDFLYRWQLGLLRQWFWGDESDVDSGAVGKCREVAQKKHEQQNLTRGYLVPAKNMMKAGMQRISLREPATW
jgi:hypothetical protein